MLYNRVKEHVVNDKKKMYKRGSQWVVVSAFAIALGGVAFTQVQPVSAATTESRLTVQPVTLTQQGQSTGASTQHESASSIQSEQTTAQTTAAPSQAAVSQAAAPQQSVATYQDANSSVASTPTPSGMTEAEWQAQKAKYDQAKSSAAQSEAAATQKASEATASYASSLAAQSEAQAQRDQSSLAAASSSATSSLAALKQQQDSNYAAASQSANTQIASLNSQRTSGEPTEQVSDGGTFDYVAEHGLWTNVVTHKDAGKAWNGNYLVQNLPVFKDPTQSGLMDALYNRLDNDQPKWSLGDVVHNNQLSSDQKDELNQYAMMLVNNYRKSMGLSSIQTTQDFLNSVQKRGQTLTNISSTSHDEQKILDSFGYDVDETLSSIDLTTFAKDENNPSMMELMEAMAQSIEGLFNSDEDSYQGHRNILLSNDKFAGFSLQYNNVQKAWILNSNGTDRQLSGVNIATVPAQTSTTPTQDDNKEIDQKIQQVKDNLQALKNTQNQQYHDAQTNLRNSLQELTDQFTASEAQTQKGNDSRLKEFTADQNQALATFIAALNKKVEALNPGPKPTTPSSGASSSSASSSSASSAGSSASSSASSSSASSAGSSASSSASSSSASSAGSSASSSASSSSASSAGSSASSSASSSSTSSAGSSASSSASSSSASSAGSSAFSSASSSSASSAGSSASSSASSSSASSTGSSASSSTSSSSASSAGTTASSSTSSSSTSSAAVAPLGTTQSTTPQPMSRMAQKNGKHAYPATGEGQTGLLLAEAGAAIIAVLGFADVRKARHAK